MTRQAEPVERSDGVVRIRPYRADDVDRLYEAVRESMDDLMPWLPWCHHGYTRDESAEWVASRPVPSPGMREKPTALPFSMRATTRSLAGAG